MQVAAAPLLFHLSSDKRQRRYFPSTRFENPAMLLQNDVVFQKYGSDVTMMTSSIKTNYSQTFW